MLETDKVFAGLKKRKKNKKHSRSYRDSQAEIMKRKRSAERDIGAIPEIVNLDRRCSCENDLERFGLTYFPARFDKAVSPNHKKAIYKIQYAILTGGLFAFAMPRGDGKTSWSEIAVLWGALYGHIKFPVIIGSDKEAAEDILKSIQTELESNDSLYEDFPEVCFPIRELDGVSNRAKGQICEGKHTNIKWNASEIIFPSVGDTVTSGTVIKARGLLGRIRGMRHTLPTGGSIRPDLAVLDDPQTDESANSDTQCKRRETVIRSAIMGLSGPGEDIAAVMPCTIIKKGDLADRMLDRKRNPEWRGEITRMIIDWPEDMEFWEDEYRNVYLAGLDAEDESKAANDFYLENRARLEKGASVAWEDRKTDKDITALQHAMNLYFKVGCEAFMSEYQNNPVSPDDSIDIITVDELERKTNGYKRGIVPLSATLLTMGTDLHDKLIYYLLCAWELDEDGIFKAGYVIDYGTNPPQSSGHFTLAGATKTLQSIFKGAGKEAAIKLGLEAIVKKYLNFDFQKSNDTLIKISKQLVDRGYQPDIAQAVKREHGTQALDLALGRGITAAKQPMSSYKKQPGETHGFHWYCPTVRKTREFPHVVIDTNFWKTFIVNALTVLPADHGNITLFGSRNTNHRLLAEHLVASESFTETEGNGRRLQEWSERPGKPDNHWFDCIVQCAVAAAMCGMRLPGQEEEGRSGRRKRKKVNLSERLANRR